MRQGQTVFGAFRVAEHCHLDDVDMEAYVIKNEANNLTVVKIIPNDKGYYEATFDVAFCTPPVNSHGTQHVIEHSVLCGSKHFKLKEPFQNLLQSSLNTYLNASTYTAHTTYPFATRNEQDFYNIMEVYLDAAFNPAIHDTDISFGQEGHFLRAENGTLMRQGVVLNEMKGVYSDPESAGGYKLREMMFQDSQLRFNSGGAPDEIPKLTYEEFVQFHREHYTTDNAVVVLVSHYDVAKELAVIDKYTRDAFRGTPARLVKQQRYVDGTATMEYGVQQEGENQEIFMNGFRLYDHDTVDPVEKIAIGVLDELLHDSPASPFKEELGGQFKSCYDAGEQQTYVFVINTGSRLPFDEQQAVLRRVYAQLAEENDSYINQQAATAILTKKLLKQREISDIYGIKIANRVFDAMLNGRRVDTFFHYNKAAEQLMADPGLAQYLKGLVSKYFQRSVAVRMVPSVGLDERRSMEERQQLQELYKQLTEGELRQIISRQEQIAARQKQTDDPQEVAKLGRLSRDDLSHMGDTTLALRGQEVLDGAYTFFEYAVASSGVCYLTIAYDITAFVQLSNLSQLNYLSYILGKVPTDSYTTTQKLNQCIDGCTGGISASVSARDVRGANGGATIHLVIETKFLGTSAAQAIALVHELVHTSYKHLDDNNKLKIQDQLVNQLKSSLQDGIDAAYVAANRATGGQSAASAIYDYLHGVRAVEGAKNSFDELVSGVFAEIDTCPVVFAIGGSADDISLVKNEIKASFRVAAAASERRKHFTLIQEQGSIASSITVNYVAKGYDHKQPVSSSALLVANTLLERSYLWDNVRVLGGAYGCFLITDMLMKQFVVSYRDPHVEETIRVFEGMPEYLQSLRLSEEQLFSVKIGAIGRRQKSIAPRSQFKLAYQYYTLGVDIEAYTRVLDGIVDVRLEEIHAASSVYGKLAAARPVVFGKSEEVKKFAGDKPVDEI